jgi:glyoxylase-like metal-dependent hydrolase (beta-lactamase superfamily II)
MARPRLDLEQTALAHVERLGFDRRDVRDIVVTHLDLDHAGGLSDFPDATVHVYEPEHHAATVGPTLAERRRYRALQLSHGPKWQRYTLEGDTWRGLRAVRALSDDVLLVPTVGHSRGHVAVAVRDGDGYLLHAGDAYFHHEEMSAPPRCPSGLRAFQSLVAFDDRLRVENQGVLRELARDHADVRVFSAHSEHELLLLRQERAARPTTTHG